MTTPIKSSNSANSPLNGTAASPAMSDLASKLNASANGTDAQGQQLAFSRWMEKHAVTAQEPSPQPQAPKAPTTSPTPVQGNATSRAAEQALARSRQQAMDAAKQIEQPATNVARPADKNTRPKTEANTNKPVRKEPTKASSADKTDKADASKDEKGDKDEVSFNTAMGDGAAVVRELTPPNTIQAGDSAGMMAWLASLTHGDAGQGKAGAALAEQGDANGQAGTLGQGLDPKGVDAALHDKQAGAASPSGIALDNPLWQSVSNHAALQVDALIAQGPKSADGRTDADPLAGLLANGGIKGPAFGAGLADGASAVRHESATLPTPLNAPDFAQALADQVSMWVGSTKADGTMTAELHLNPAEMGPINVKIALDGQSAQVDFAAAALETRQAIEASLPMLSSALSDVGLSMTGGDVSSQTAQQSFDQASGRPDGGAGRSSGLRGRGEDDGGPDAVSMRPVAAPRSGRLGGLDLYA